MVKHARRPVILLALMVPGFWLGTLTTPTPGQSPAAKEARSRIDDAAGLFSAEALKSARSELARIEAKEHVPTVIETVDSLHGVESMEAIKSRITASAFEALHILLSKQEKRLQILPALRLRATFPQARLDAIRDAMLPGLAAGHPDNALRDGVRAIESTLDTSRKAAFGFLSPGSNHPADEALIVRNQVKLTLSGARRIIAGAESKAAALNLKVNIAVVDDGGHLLSFARMDGARPASGYTAITKATTAATFRQESGPLPKGTTTPDPLLNLSLQNAAAASGGKLTTLYGGIPVTVDSQVIGGVGVGGGTGEQDAEVARAGVAAFLSALGASEAPGDAKR
jgi:glc operon protein GlcG